MDTFQGHYWIYSTAMEVENLTDTPQEIDMYQIYKNIMMLSSTKASCVRVYRNSYSYQTL